MNYKNTNRTVLMDIVYVKQLCLQGNYNVSNRLTVHPYEAFLQKVTTDTHLWVTAEAMTSISSRLRARDKLTVQTLSSGTISMAVLIQHHKHGTAGMIKSSAHAIPGPVPNVCVWGDGWGVWCSGYKWVLTNDSGALYMNGFCSEWSDSISKNFKQLKNSKYTLSCC